MSVQGEQSSNAEITALTNLAALATSGAAQAIRKTGALTFENIDIETALGTVTSVSVVSANGISGTVATATTTPAITLSLGSITPSAVQVSGLTASEIVGTDGSKNLVSLAVATYPSLTELSYVKGVSSAIQTQIDAKASGPASATDNAIVRFDGVTGKLVQDSAVTIADTTGLITTAGGVAGTGSATGYFPGGLRGGGNAGGDIGFTNSGITIATGSKFGWTAGVSPSAAFDTALVRTSAGNISVGNGTVNYWTIGSGGLLAATDNTYDIGAAGATRPKNIYAAGTIIAGSNIDSGGRVTAVAASWLGWTGRTIMRSPADGALTLANQAENDFTLLRFGGATASYPAIKRSLATIAFRVADDTANASISALAGTFSGALSASNLSGTNTGDQTTVSGNAGTATALQTARAIYGNNFDGTAALTQIIASTYGGTGNGFTKFTGATTAEKTYTLPDASTTILTTSYTGALATGILLNTTTTGALTIAVAGDFPTLNQNTTGSAATLTTTRTIWGQNFNGSANVTGDITLGVSSITMTGSLAATAARVTKGWFTDVESTNMPTVGGTSLSSTFAAVAQTFYIGTTQVAINRGSAALTLAGITLTTPDIGVATATSVNKVAITAPATNATLTIAEGKTLTASNTITFTATDGSTLAIGTGGTLGTGAYATIANYAPLTSPTFATSINGSFLTASEILITDGSKNIVSAAVATYPSLTELTYVKGVTSAIQTQLNGKQASDTQLTAIAALADAAGALTNDGAGNLSWSAAGAGANTALSNLAAVAINTTLVSDTDNTDALGTAAIGWSDLWLGSGAVITFSTAPSTADITITHSADTLTFAGGTVALGTATATGGLTGNVTGNVSGSSGSCTGLAASATVLATPRAIYGNNFDGSAALAQIIASTYGGTGNGFTKFSGATTAEKTYTLPDSSVTLLYSGGALGTPSGGTLTNCTGLPLTGLTGDATTALAVGTIELGHATDTTLSRSAAGVLAVEGVAVPTISSTHTLTNKRITQRVVTTTDDATAVIDVDVTDLYELSAVANATTFTLTGTPTDGQKLIVRYKDAGVAKGLTWTGFTAIGITLPTTTTVSKWGYVGCVYNSAATQWQAIATTTEA